MPCPAPKEHSQHQTCPYRQSCGVPHTRLHHLQTRFCNSLLAGLPGTTLGKLQSIQNAAARLDYSQVDHITPVLREPLASDHLPDFVVYKIPVT